MYHLLKPLKRRYTPLVSIPMAIKQLADNTNRPQKKKNKRLLLRHNHIEQHLQRHKVRNTTDLPSSLHLPETEPRALLGLVGQISGSHTCYITAAAEVRKVATAI